VPVIAPPLQIGARISDLAARIAVSMVIQTIILVMLVASLVAVLRCLHLLHSVD